MHYLFLLIALFTCAVSCSNKTPHTTQAVYTSAHILDYKNAGLDPETLKDPLHTGDGSMFRLFTQTNTPPSQRSSSLAKDLLAKVQQKQLPVFDSPQLKPHTADELAKILGYPGKALPQDGITNTFELSILYLQIAKAQNLRTTLILADPSTTEFHELPKIFVHVKVEEDKDMYYDLSNAKQPLLERPPTKTTSLNSLSILSIHYTRLSNFELWQKRTKDAQTLAKQAVTFAPEMSFAQIRLAQAYEILEQYEPALKHMSIAATFRKTPWVQIAVARLMRKATHLQASLAKLVSLRKNEPENPNVAHEYALTLCALDQGSQALELLSAFAPKHQEAWSLHRDAALIALGMQKPDRARSFVELGQRAKPKLPLWRMFYDALDEPDREEWELSLYNRVTELGACTKRDAPNSPKKDESHN